MARRKKPYIVIPLDTESILDFKELAKDRYTFTKVDKDGSKVKWLKIKWLLFNKAETDTIKVKYDSKLYESSQ